MYSFKKGNRDEKEGGVISHFEAVEAFFDLKVISLFEEYYIYSHL